MNHSVRLKIKIKLYKDGDNANEVAFLYEETLKLSGLSDIVSFTPLITFNISSLLKQNLIWSIVDVN